MNTPTRDRPTAMAFDGDTIVYWRGDSDWRACRFGAATPLEITPELREAIERDVQHAREKE